MENNNNSLLLQYQDRGRNALLGIELSRRHIIKEIKTIQMYLQQIDESIKIVSKLTNQKK